MWSDYGIEEYQKLLESKLDELTSRWCYPESLSNMSILISATYSVLNIAAKATNKFVDLSRKPRVKRKVDPEIANLRKKVLQLHKEKKALDPLQHDLLAHQSLENQLIAARSHHKRKIREYNTSHDAYRDFQLSSFKSNLSPIFKSIKKTKNKSSCSISRLCVAGEVYDNVSHGFHRSLSLLLKDPDMTSVESSEAFQETLRDFNNIMQIVIRGNKILPIQVHESIEILYSVRRNVNDCTRLQQSISSMQDHLDCDIFNVSWKQSLQTLIIHHCKSLMISGQLYCIRVMERTKNQIDLIGQ